MKEYVLNNLKTWQKSSADGKGLINLFVELLDCYLLMFQTVAPFNDKNDTQLHFTTFMYQHC